MQLQPQIMTLHNEHKWYVEAYILGQLKQKLCYKIWTNRYQRSNEIINKNVNKLVR